MENRNNVNGSSKIMEYADVGESLITFTIRLYVKSDKKARKNPPPSHKNTRLLEDLYATNENMKINRSSED